MPNFVKFLEKVGPGTKTFDYILGGLDLQFFTLFSSEKLELSV